MSLDIFNFVKEMLSSPEQMGKFEDLLKKAMSSMKEVASTLKSAPPEVREKAQKELESMQSLLKEKMETVAEAMGLPLEDLEGNLDKMMNFDAKDLLGFEAKEEAASEKSEKKAPVSRRKKWINA